jgi:hypothetical protein
VTPANQIGEPTNDDSPTPGRWYYLPREEDVRGSYNHGPMVLSRLGEDVIHVAEFESAADAVLCSYAPEMQRMLRKILSQLGQSRPDIHLRAEINRVLSGIR